MERNIKKRRILRSSITRLNGSIDQALSEESTVEHLKELLDLCSRKYEELVPLDEEISQEIDDEFLEDEAESQQKYRDEMTIRKSRLTHRIDKINRELVSHVGRNQTADVVRLTEVDEVRGDSGDSVVESVGSRDGTRSCEVKLPKWNIASFDGSITEWPAFWARFESAVHSRQSLHKIEKFNYLKGYLKGSAAAAIEGLLLTPENYDIAIEALQDRFGKRDIIINAHMTLLLGIQAVKRSSDTRSLRRFLDTVTIQVRSLNALGVLSESFSTLLCPILIKAMPPDLVLELHRQQRSELSVSKLIEFLKYEVESRERTSMVHAGLGHQEANHKSSEERKSFSAAALLSVEENKCIFCKDDHKSSVCTAKSAKEKHEILRRDGRCYICLGPRHLAKNCKRKTERCEVCSKRHHASLCLGKEIQATNTNTYTVTNADNGQILLQTISVLVSGSDSRNVVGLLDSGSQRSYISEELCSFIQPEVIGYERLRIKGFGSKTTCVQSYQVVRLQLRDTNHAGGDIKVNALVVPFISNSIPTLDGSKTDKISRNRNLSMTGLKGTQTLKSLGLLIGSDHYWQIVTGKCDRINENLVAVETIFGWCLHGKSNAQADTQEPLVLCVDSETCESIDQGLRRFWEIESLGIYDEEKDDNNAAAEIFNRTLVKEENFYKVGLLWNGKEFKLKNNHLLAKKRLTNLVSKLRRQPKLAAAYQEIIDQQRRDGILEVAQAATTGVEFYIPHHRKKRLKYVLYSMRQQD